MTVDPITLLLAGVAGMLAVGALFAWMVRVLRQETGPERIVACLLAVLIAESALYADPNDVATGLFHPQAGPLSFRIFDILLPLALIALAVARPPRRNAFPVQVLLWAAFLGWLVVAAVAGVYEGNSFGIVAYQVKGVMYLGTFVLVAVVPARRWLESRALRRVVIFASVMAFVLILTSEAGLRLSLAFPPAPLVGFGPMGSDAASLFAVLGLGVLCVAFCSDRRRLRTVLLALPLLAAPLVSGQRAAMLGVAAAFGAMLLLGPFALRNVRVRGTEIVLAGLAVLAVVMALVVYDGVTGGTDPALPLATQIQETFGSRGKQLSEQDRVNQWAQARGLISERPWFGWGLGKEYDYYSPGFFEFMRTDITHNITTDLLLRTGVVGLLLFLAAFAASLRDSALGWLREADARLAALALAVCCSLAGLLVKGLVESLFEKYRLAIVIGALVGVSISIAAARLAAVEASAPTWAPAARRRRGALAR